MPALNHLVEFLNGTGPFCGFGFQQLTSFNWSISPQLREIYPQLPPGDGHGANVALRHAFAESWYGYHPLVDRQTLGTRIIRDFGRVRGNTPATIAAHVANAEQEVPDTPLAGIASLSKILAMKGLNRYAILDARVGVALNAICLIGRPERARLLPYLPSQNRRIIRFRQQHQLSAILGVRKSWDVCSNVDGYEYYVALLKRAAGQVHRPLYDIEMCLFSQSIALCDLVDGMA